MYLSVLEQFEIVPFLAYVSQTLWLPYSVLSFILFIIFCLILCTLKQKESWSFKGVKASTKVKDVQEFDNYRYDDCPPESGNKKRILITINTDLRGHADINYNCQILESAYTNHPWFKTRKAYSLYVLGRYECVSQSGKKILYHKIGEGNTLHLQAFNTYLVHKFFLRVLGEFCQLQKNNKVKAYKLYQVHILCTEL